MIATEKLAHALEAVGINLRDHLIISEDDYVSLRDSAVGEHFRGSETPC